MRHLQIKPKDMLLDGCRVWRARGASLWLLPGDGAVGTWQACDCTCQQAARAALIEPQGLFYDVMQSNERHRGSLLACAVHFPIMLSSLRFSVDHVLSRFIEYADFTAFCKRVGGLCMQKAWVSYKAKGCCAIAYVHMYIR